MFLVKLKKPSLVLASTIANVAAVYFAFPFYLEYVAGKFVRYVCFGDEITKGVIDIIRFRVWASTFSLIGVGLGLVAFVLARQCRKQGLKQTWKIGRICSLYAVAVLCLLVAMLWIQFSYQIGDGGMNLRIGFIFVTSLLG